MPFTPKYIARPYAYAQSPTLPGSDRKFYERELRSLAERLNEAIAAVKELQDYLIANP